MNSKFGIRFGKFPGEVLVLNMHTPCPTDEEGKRGRPQEGERAFNAACGFSELPHARKLALLAGRNCCICHTHMALVGICLLHAPTTTSPFFSSAGQIMSLLLVTTGATSALLVNRGLSAPTFVSLCNYLMLGAYACESGLFSLLFVAV